MDTELPHLKADEHRDVIVTALEEVGGVIVEDMLAPDEIRSLEAELRPFLDDADPGREFVNPSVAWFFGEHTRHLTALASKSPTFVEALLLNPVMLGAADEILGPNCASYVLNLGHLLDRGPDRQPTPEEFAVAEMPAGSSVIYLGSTIHAGGTNSSRKRRPGIHMSYVVGWLRTEENNYLATPPELARTLPRRAQELVGYAAHDAIDDLGGYLGALDLRDPVEMLASGEI